jgi:hypothetical protein
MRKLIMVAAAVVLIGSAQLSLSNEAFAIGGDDYDDSQSHPLRLIAYLVHPIGYTLEWLVTRPFHELVAQPDLEPVFGHTSHEYYGDAPVGTAVTTERYRD